LIYARIGESKKVLIVFDNAQHKDWIKDGKVSQKGIEPLLKKFIDAGLDFSEVSALCLADTQDSKPKATEYKYKAPYVDELIETYGFNVCIPVGAGAFEKITGRKGAAKYFGKTLISEKYAGLKVLPCPNPAQAKHDPGIMNVIASVVKQAVVEKEFPEIREADKLETHYTILDSIPKLQGFFQHYTSPLVREVAYDTETTGLYFNIDSITTIQFSHKPGYSYLIPCNGPECPAVLNLWSEEEWAWIKAQITLIFTDPNKLIIGHNKKFDDKFINHHWGVPLQKGRSFDTMIASFLCDENTPNGLKDLTCQLTDMGDYELELERFKDEYCKKHKILKKPSTKNPGKPVFSYGMIPFETLAQYALCDSDATFRLYLHFKEELKKEEQEKTFELVMRINWLLTRFELNGWPINVEYGRELQKKFEKEIAEMEVELLAAPNITKAVEVLTQNKLKKETETKNKKALEKLKELRGEFAMLEKPYEGIDPKFLKQMEKERVSLQKKIDKATADSTVRITELKQPIVFKLGSVPQKQVLFFDVMKMDVVKRTKKGAPATDKEAMSIWMRSEPRHKEFLQKIQHYSEMCKFLSTYVIGVLSKTVNGRVHGTYNACGAKTGRSSSRDPNLQNLPARGDERKMKLVKAIKKMFEAPEGRVLLGADLSAIEMRWAAIVSGDEKLIEIFKQGIDIHGAIAKELFDYITCPPNDVKKQYEFERNSVSKTVQFLSIYGGGPDALAKKVNESIIERQELAKSKGETLDLQEYTKDMAQQILDEYFAKYKGVDQYIKDMTISTLEKGYALSYYGYKRRVPAINSDDEGIKAQAVRQAINATIQNPASVSLLLSICNLQEEIDESGSDVLLIGSCHDANYSEVSRDGLVEARDRLLYHMTQPPMENCPIPMAAEAEWGKNWAEFSEDFGTALVDEEELDEEEDEDMEELEAA